jgi:hypothetical protein
MPEPQLEIAVYNEAGVASSVWTAAAEIAISVFERAGTTLVWSDCPGPACPERFGPNSLVVKVARRKSIQWMKWPGGACGAAFVAADAGYYAVVDYDCVVASGSPFETSAILAHTIAHETGHLLLGDRSHAAAGLMKKRWGAADKADMGQRRLNFQPAEADRLRDALRRRLTRSAHTFRKPAGS